MSKDESFSNDIFLGLIGMIASKTFRFDIDYYFFIIRAIEKDIGDLDMIPNITQFPSHQDEIKEYFIEKIIANFIHFSEYGKSIKMDVTGVVNDRILVSSKSIQCPPKKNNPSLKEEFEKTGKIRVDILFYNMDNNQRSIEKYIISWEYLLSNFINPIFQNLEKAQKISQDLVAEVVNFPQVKKSGVWPNHLKIKAVREYLERSESTKPLIPIIDDMDTELRNSLVHNMYYIKEQILYYFRQESPHSLKFKEKQIEMMHMHIMTMYQIFHLMLVNILTSMKYIDPVKIKQVLGIDLDEKGSKK